MPDYKQFNCYRAGWLIDGNGHSAIENVIFCVKDKYFNKIFKYKEDIDIKKNVIDMSEYTILPCLIDGHVHLSFSGTTNSKLRKYQLKKNCKNRNKIISNNMQQHLLSGVAIVRDCGDPNNDILQFKHHFQKDNLFCIDVLSSGMAWYKNGCYGSFIGNPLEPDKTLAQSIAKRCRSRDFIKIINSGLNSLKIFGAETSEQFSYYDIKSSIAAPALINKKIAIHANGIIPVNSAIESGCHSLEHGFFMGERNLDLMAKKSTIWIPTLYTMKSYMNLIDNRYQELSRVIASKNLETQLEQLSIARKIGVTVAIGTDSGSFGINHGESIKEELKLFIEAGYTVEEALSCATKNGARLINDSKSGLIREGMKANFIAIKAKPYHIIDALDRIDYIFIDGEKIST